MVLKLVPLPPVLSRSLCEASVTRELHRNIQYEAVRKNVRLFLASAQVVFRPAITTD